MYSSIIICKVVRHGLDLLLDPCKICAFLLLPQSTLWYASVWWSVPDSLRFGLLLSAAFYRNGILSCILHAFDPADGIRMSLAYALAPEGIILAFWKNSICIQHGSKRTYPDPSLRKSIRHCRFPLLPVSTCLKMLRNSWHVYQSCQSH